MPAYHTLIVALSALVALEPVPALAEPASFSLVLKNHRFEPETLEVPANAKLELHIRNLDTDPEEFDSTDLRREQVVGPGQKEIVFVGPLRPGTYAFIGEDHPATAHGTLIAR